MKFLVPNKKGLLSRLKEPLARFGSHIVEDALPYLLATDVIERLCSEGERARASNWGNSGQRGCKTRGLRFGACHRQMPNPVALARAPLGSRLFGITRYGRPIARHHNRTWTGPALEVK